MMLTGELHRLILDFARARSFGFEAGERESLEALWERPGRAAGKVTAWSLERALICLQRHARRPIFQAPGDHDASPLETAFLQTMQCLGASDMDEARRRATFLIKPDGIETFLSALTPAATSLANAA
ncbi:MAG: hypothetical protein AAGH90_07025 [Pseudomonadota bacterium]